MNTLVVHGDPESLAVLAETLGGPGGVNVLRPDPSSTVDTVFPGQRDKVQAVGAADPLYAKYGLDPSACDPLALACFDRMESDPPSALLQDISLQSIIPIPLVDRMFPQDLRSTLVDVWGSASNAMDVVRDRPDPTFLRYRFLTRTTSPYLFFERLLSGLLLDARPFEAATLSCHEGALEDAFIAYWVEANGKDLFFESDGPTETEMSAATDPREALRPAVDRLISLMPFSWTALLR